MAVVIETTLGDITVDLYTKERPNSCLNFLKLCKIKYYNYCLFHSVQRNFVVQTGDPSDSGRGGESVFRALYGDQAKYFDGEALPKIKHKHAGTLSMINNGNGQYGSQFLLTTGENLDYLDGKHVVFGEVAEGFDILMKINEAFCDESHRPYQDIRITHTVILDDPFDDPDGLKVPDRSPELSEEQLKDPLRIAAHEKIDDYEGMTTEERREIEETKEADHKAQVLEMIGDLPDKDVAPPDHVLFICKLNAVTTDEDLEIIFSRFGTIVSCEIIRDRKTGDSLQYAFVEFSNAEECEKAYLKMDNVLIDDRRIHVDFSQSVSKLQYPKQPPLKVEKKDRPRNTNSKYDKKSPERRRENSRDTNNKSRESTNDREVRCGKHSKRDVDKHKKYRHQDEYYPSKSNKVQSRSPRRYSRSPSPKRSKKSEDNKSSHKNNGKFHKKSEKINKKFCSDEEVYSKKSHSSKKHKKDKSHKKKRHSTDSSS